VVETDEVVDEDALLGQATLAKLSATRKPDDPVPQMDKSEEKPGDFKSEEEKSAKEKPAEAGQAE
jgi:hypothetical protein